MAIKKNILAISGSTRLESVNRQILSTIAGIYHEEADFILYNDIGRLPHFNPDTDKEPVPPEVQELRNLVASADGIIICTPEYVFSLPGSLKNAIEWMVSTTLFTGKTTALITASSSGQKAHESLQLVMQTVGAEIAQETSLLIQAPKTKINTDGTITDRTTMNNIQQLMHVFLQRIAPTKQ